MQLNIRYIYIYISGLDSRGIGEKKQEKLQFKVVQEKCALLEMYANCNYV